MLNQQNKKTNRPENKPAEPNYEPPVRTPALPSTPLTSASGLPAGGAVSSLPTTRIQPQKQLDSLKIAKFVSLLLHPFLISPLSIVLILWLDQGNLLAAIGWAALCAAFVVAPASLYLGQKLKQKRYTDADVSVREHRYGFYIFGGLCMLACFITLLWLEAPNILIAGFIAALCALLLAALINRLWTKVSIHAGAMVGVMAAAAFYSLPLALLLALGAIAVTWARLITQRHTITEAIAAWLIALVCVGGVFGPMLMGM